VPRDTAQIDGFLFIARRRPAAARTARLQGIHSGRARLSGRSPEDEIIGIDQALDELAKVDGQLVRVVEMRYFAGHRR
jgi:hypothetical protein